MRFRCHLSVGFLVNSAERRKRDVSSPVVYPIRPSPVSVLYRSLSARYDLCADNWTPELSDLVCQKMGHMYVLTEVFRASTAELDLTRIALKSQQ